MRKNLDTTNISSTISRANKRYTYDLYTVGILIEGVMDFEVQMTPRLTYYVDSSGKIVQPVNDPVLDMAIHDFVVYDFSFKTSRYGPMFRLMVKQFTLAVNFVYIAPWRERHFIQER